MTEHESVREWLNLAAAGVLSAEEHRQVEQHAADCEICRRELEARQGYTRELGRLPAPAVPAHLAERTRVRIAGTRKAAAEQRWSGVVLTVLALYAWTIARVSWVVWRIFTGDAMSLFETGFVKILIWSGASTAFAWVTAAVAAVVLGFQRHSARRMS